MSHRSQALPPVRASQQRLSWLVLLCLLIAGCSDGQGRPTAARPVTVHVATVANPQMEDARRLVGEFERTHPGIRVRFSVLDENELRDRITEDVATGAGRYDVATIGTYETPLWARNNWIRPLDGLMRSTPDYDADDLVPTVRQALSYRGREHAVPFYAESSFLMYRRDLLARAGLEMPARPTWRQVERLASRLHAPKRGRAGICLRGLPGWGENMAPLNTVVNTMGGRWFDERWEAQLAERPFRQAAQFYVNLVRRYGEPNAGHAGFKQCLEAFSGGKAAMWYDATSAAGLLEDPTSSQVAGRVGYAPAPVQRTARSGWLWAWALAIPTSAKQPEAAWEFVSWMTSKKYLRLVGERMGWSRVPPGTRQSTYELPEYARSARAFAPLTLASIRGADVTRPGVRPVPYQGIQSVGIPEFAVLGTAVGEQIGAAIDGHQSVDQALAQAQRMAAETAQVGGYRRTGPGVR